MRAIEHAVLPATIALSVQIAPSRRLRLLLYGAALVHAGSACAMFSNLLDVAFPSLLAGASGIAALLCARAAARPRTMRQIDISKAGALRLTVQQELPPGGRAVRLLRGSLLWGKLLVLRFDSIDAGPMAPQTVVVLPDSTAPEAFRKLSVALRAIAGHSASDATQK